MLIGLKTSVGVGEVGKANGVDGSYGHHSASFPFASGCI